MAVEQRINKVREIREQRRNDNIEFWVAHACSCSYIYIRYEQCTVKTITTPSTTTWCYGNNNKWTDIVHTVLQPQNNNNHDNAYERIQGELSRTILRPTVKARIRT